MIISIILYVLGVVMVRLCTQHTEPTLDSVLMAIWWPLIALVAIVMGTLCGAYGVITGKKVRF